MNKVLKFIVNLIGGLLLLSVIFLVVIFTKQYFLDEKINDDYSGIYQDKRYKDPVEVLDVQLVKQDISCGYAVIEMFSDWSGNPVSEEALYEMNNDAITTAMGDGFCDEMNIQLKNYRTERYTNLTNLELIEMVYGKLEEGIPVPIELAALYETEDESVWTLHFALVTGMDVENDVVTVYNPYGYVENYSIEEFLNATRYDAYENMEFYFKIAFALGIFDKNTVYMVE